MSDDAFDRTILTQLNHRPWPVPDAPWVMTQSWHDLLFAHWPVDKKRLRSQVPAPLEVELFDGEAWIGIVPFHMTNVAPRGVPALPWVSTFPEVNVRTYVRVGSKPGVFFFSLDAGHPIAVAVARAIFDLPYHLADMQIEEADGMIRYASHRTATRPADLVASYRPVGPEFVAPRSSLDYFLTERYCLYLADARLRPVRLEIHHPPWRLQRAEAQFEQNTMADAVGIRLPQRAPVLHFAKRQDVVAWLPQTVTADQP